MSTSCQLPVDYSSLTSNINLENAIHDQDLTSKLLGLPLLGQRKWRLPAWLPKVPEVIGYPDRLPAHRKADLMAHRILPTTDDERRFTRNSAVVKQITAELKRANEAGAWRPAPAPVPQPDSMVSKKLNGAAPLIEPAPNGSALVTAAETDQEQADRLRQTVLAPFYKRIEEDREQILRLRQEKAEMKAQITQSEEELAALQQAAVVKEVAGASEELTRLREKEGIFTTEIARLRDDILALQQEQDADKHSSSSHGTKRKAVTLENDGILENHLTHLADKISKDLDETVANETLHLCGLAPLKILETRPEAVLALAREKIHAWPYRRVPICWCRLYEDASLWFAVERLREWAEVQAYGVSKKRKIEGDAASPRHHNWLANIVEILDRGITVSGAPGRSSTFDAFFQQLDNFRQDEEADRVVGIPFRWAHCKASPPGIVTDYAIERATQALSMHAFQHYLDKRNMPLIIPDTLKHWPASERWQQPTYLIDKTLGGRRYVPVEVGKMYTDDDFTQTVMPFSTFMKDHLIPTTPPTPPAYLAQHDLFAQIPSLKADILTPDYVYTSPPPPPAGLSQAEIVPLQEPLLNAWLGPKGTKTPLHTDPYYNILCQVVGYKYVRLYAPSESEKLYPRIQKDDTGIAMENTSHVDVSAARSGEVAVAEEFPLFKDASFVEAVLGPGECLFVPAGWWHYVEGLTTSFSVSFWWN